jgi:hypothetical protein
MHTLKNEIVLDNFTPFIVYTKLFNLDKHVREGLLTQSSETENCLKFLPSNTKQSLNIILNKVTKYNQSALKCCFRSIDLH